MAKTGRSYSGQRSPSHMTSEASRLREIVQEQEDSIRAIRGIAEEGRSTVRETAAAHILTDILHACDDALDGGGDAP